MTAKTSPPTLPATTKRTPAGTILWWVITSLGTVAGIVATTPFLPPKYGSAPELIIAVTVPAAVLASLLLTFSAMTLPKLTKEHYGYAQACGWLVAPFALAALTINMFRWDTLANAGNPNQAVIWTVTAIIMLIASVALIVQAFRAGKTAPHELV